MQKKLILSAVLCLLSSVLWLAAATYTKQNARIPRFEIDTTFNGGTGTATAVKAHAFIERVLVNDTDANDVLDRVVWQRVTFDLLDPTLASTNITAAGKTVTYPHLAALLRQASLDQATAQGQP